VREVPPDLKCLAMLEILNEYVTASTDAKADAWIAVRPPDAPACPPAHESA
jgi:hypothetical protein